MGSAAADIHVCAGASPAPSSWLVRLGLRVAQALGARLATGTGSASELELQLELEVTGTASGGEPLKNTTCTVQ